MTLEELLYTTALPGWGGFAFGTILGWVTNRTLRLREGKASWQDLGHITAMLLGAAITTVFQDPIVFGAYCIGLAVGFFGYLVTHASLFGKRSVASWMSAPRAEKKTRSEIPNPPAR